MTTIVAILYNTNIYQLNDIGLTLECKEIKLQTTAKSFRLS